MEKFKQQKQKQLYKKDKSSIGSWDKKIIPLCKKINKNKEYYTTSSCSGRVVLIKASDKKQKNLFLYRTHNKISFKELLKQIKNIKYPGLIYFKQEPCILHVACNFNNDAEKLLKKARLAGWKRSGLISKKRNILELMSTEHLEFPIMNNRKLLVSEAYLKLITKEANSRLKRTWQKITRLKTTI